MSTDNTPALQVDDLPSRIEQVLIEGDLAPLNTDERVTYYNKVCASIGVNPLTKPFDYIRLNNKLTLYARKDCTDQLRRVYSVSIVSLEKQMTDKMCVVTATAELPNGRRDVSSGVVVTAGLTGDSMANALMKCETKAKRRVTLSICGLGFLDESEVDTIGFDRQPTQPSKLQQINAQVMPPEPAEAPPEPDDADLADERLSARENGQVRHGEWQAVNGGQLELGDMD